MSRQDVGDLVEEIRGTITLVDGTTSEFTIHTDALGWQQFGADRERLGKTGTVVDSLTNVLRENELVPTANQLEAYDEDSDEEVCRADGCLETTHGGEGYDGYCGNHADQAEKREEWS